MGNENHDIYGCYGFVEWHTILAQETLKADYEGNRLTAIVAYTLTFSILFRIQGYRMRDDTLGLIKGSVLKLLARVSDYLTLERLILRTFI